MKRMRRILLSLVVITVAATAVVAGTRAFFSDTETSTGNIFAAGTIDLKVDHTRAIYNDEVCNQDCEVTGDNLLANGSFEKPTVVDNGGDWQLFDEINGWVNAGDAKIELQRGVFGSKHLEQHLELDSDPQGNSASSIEQTIETTPGTRYQLSFWYSARPEGDSEESEVNFKVQALSSEGTELMDAIVSGQGPIAWKEANYQFTAVGSETTLTFSQGGPANTYGGLVDLVSIREMECTNENYENTTGGYCELWESKNLADEKFFEFYDVKPGDNGSNLISLTVEDNEAYLCLGVNNQENTPEEAEEALGDNIMVKGWYADGYGTKGDVLFDWTSLNDLGNITYADGEETVTPGETNYALLEWCFGNPTDGCDGSEKGNGLQGTQVMADLQFYATQSRNQGGFSCSDLVWESEVETQEIRSAVQNYSPTGWAGWSCPEGTQIVSATTTLENPQSVTLWKEGASVPGYNYPNTPFGYTYSDGEEGAIVQAGGTGGSAYIDLICTVND